MYCGVSWNDRERVSTVGRCGVGEADCSSVHKIAATNAQIAALTERIDEHLEQLDKKSKNSRNSISGHPGMVTESCPRRI